MPQLVGAREERGDPRAGRPPRGPRRPRRRSRGAGQGAARARAAGLDGDRRGRGHPARQARRGRQAGRRASAARREGVDFDSMDGRPTHLFFVLVAPENSTGVHLKALARISRLFKDPEFRTRLMQAKDAPEIYPRHRRRGRQVLMRHDNPAGDASAGRLAAAAERSTITVAGEHADGPRLRATSTPTATTTAPTAAPGQMHARLRRLQLRLRSGPSAATRRPAVAARRSCASS